MRGRMPRWVSRAQRARRNGQSCTARDWPRVACDDHRHVGQGLQNALPANPCRLARWCSWKSRPFSRKDRDVPKPHDADRPRRLFSELKKSAPSPPTKTWIRPRGTVLTSLRVCFDFPVCSRLLDLADSFGARSGVHSERGHPRSEGKKLLEQRMDEHRQVLAIHRCRAVNRTSDLRPTRPVLHVTGKGTGLNEGQNP